MKTYTSFKELLQDNPDVDTDYMFSVPYVDGARQVGAAYCSKLQLFAEVMKAHEALATVFDNEDDSHLKLISQDIVMTVTMFKLFERIENDMRELRRFLARIRDNHLTLNAPLRVADCIVGVMTEEERAYWRASPAITGSQVTTPAPIMPVHNLNPRACVRDMDRDYYREEKLKGDEAVFPRLEVVSTRLFKEVQNSFHELTEFVEIFTEFFIQLRRYLDSVIATSMTLADEGEIEPTYITQKRSGTWDFNPWSDNPFQVKEI